MNKNETIISVMEAFDEAERYKRECEQLRARANVKVAIENDKLTVKEPDDELPRWFTAIYEYGRRAILEKYTRIWRLDVDVRENEDGTKRAETFTHWFKDNFSEFPDFMSREDFLAEFEHELRATYDEKLAEALKED